MRANGAAVPKPKAKAVANYVGEVAAAAADLESANTGEVAAAAADLESANVGEVAAAAANLESAEVELQMPEDIVCLYKVVCVICLLTYFVSSSFSWLSE